MSRPTCSVLVCTLVAVAALASSAATIVHASDEGHPSPASSASAPADRDEPYDYGVTLIHGPPWFGRADLPDEWYGLDSNQSMLVTLKIGREGEPARLAIAQVKGTSVVTRIYDCTDVVVKYGRFSIKSQGSAIQLTGHAGEPWGGATGVGRGVLTVDGPEGPQRTELYFFKTHERSWLDDVLAAARRCGLL
jgi:hypothetical protein